MTSQPRKTKRRGRGGPRRKPRATAPPPEPIEPEPLPPVETAAPAVESPSRLLPLAEPELTFAGRAAARPPEPERPLPTTRRAIFFDVENTSRVQHISRVIDYLAVDRLGRRTDFIAVGNWRVIGHDTARLLAGHGAQLLHSAPSVGVKDWSDLRIAVAAGVWLGTARPGDVLEIISDDRAFDAVGDVATSLGISFRRLSYRRLTGTVAPMPVAAVVEPIRETPVVETRSEPRGDLRGGRRRRGRRGGYRRDMPPPVQPAPAPAVARPGAEEPHTAPHDELLGVARDLIERSSGRSVTLDTLANALKSRGFSRPPGSPRLITRLRRIRELDVSRSGQITLVSGAATSEPLSEPVAPAPPTYAGQAEAEDEPEREPQPEPVARPVPVRPTDAFEDRRAAVEAAQRGLSAAPAPLPSPPQAESPDGEAPEDAAQDGASPDGGSPDGPRRRRSRRGGRRRRRHSATT